MTTTPPLRLEDDDLSHEPDFSFRTGKKPVPATPAKFAFAKTETVDLDAVARLSPLAAPTTQPVAVVEPSITPAQLVDTTPTSPTPVVVPTQQASQVVTPIQIPVVQLKPAPFSAASLAAFILALIGIAAPFVALPVIFSLLAVILGHVGSYRARHRGLAGAGYAAAGLTIGYASLAITALVAIVVIVIAVLTGNLITYLNAYLQR